MDHWKGEGVLNIPFSIFDFWDQKGGNLERGGFIRYGWYTFKWQIFLNDTVLLHPYYV